MQFKNKKTGEIIKFEPIMINAALVSAQNRKRLFWVGKRVGDIYKQVEIPQPEDDGILLRDILEDNVEDGFFLKKESIDRVLKRGCVPPDEPAIWDDYNKKILTNNKCHTLTLPHHNATRLVCNNPIRIGQIGKGGQMENTIIRKLTPIECERLQSLTEIGQSCIIRVCKDHQNNYVNAENKCPKSQNVVGNVEKSDLKENAQFVGESLNTKNQPINKLVQPDVLINCGENTLQIHYQNKLLVNVNGAEWKQNAHHLKKIEDFVHLIVGLNTIVERIMLFGEGELLQKNNISIAVENGNNVVNLYGKGIMQLANDAEKDLITLNKLLKSTISDPSIQANNEQIIQTLFSYVVNAILGHIPKEIQNQNILTFQIKSKVGYTCGVSNTQRYKALGNGFNCAVIEHILLNLNP